VLSPADSGIVPIVAKRITVTPKAQESQTGSPPKPIAKNGHLVFADNQKILSRYFLHFQMIEYSIVNSLPLADPG